MLWYMLALVGTEKLQLGTLFWYLWCPLGEKGGKYTQSCLVSVEFQTEVPNCTFSVPTSANMCQSKG